MIMGIHTRALALTATVLSAFTSFTVAQERESDGSAMAERRNVDDTLRAWDRQFNSPRRFVVLKAFRSEAVLDRETQLVWEREPKDEPGQTTFQLAVRHCYIVTTGGRMGWRLPTAEELTSLLVETPAAAGASRAALPDGHPFRNIFPERYWSVSEGSFAGSQGDPFTPGRQVVAPANPEISTVSLETELVTAFHPTWCVRGPGGGQSTR
jgi:hypothetical protein